MKDPGPKDVLLKVRKLAMLPEEARQCQYGVEITRLTTLKSLCREPEVTNRFVTYLAQHIRQKVAAKAKRPGQLSREEWARHQEMINQAVTALEHYLGQPTEEGRSRLWTLFQDLAEEQKEYRRIHGGPVRIIKDNDLLLVEYALRTVLADQTSAPQWAYQTARHYAERHDCRYGTGLTPASAPLLQDIVDFWIQEYGLDPAVLVTPAREKKGKTEPTATVRSARKTPAKRQKAKFTHRQGQYLAYIHLYRKLHRQGPGELDLVRYFRVTPPSAHSMIVKLEELGLITKERGVPRSVRVAIPDEEIPPLE